MLLGLINAIKSFQDYINNIFLEKMNIFVIAYINNIASYLDKENYIYSIQCGLNYLKKHNVILI